MLHWLEQTPIAGLFAIIALGYLLGEVRFPGGFRLGVAGVLFVGLACGAWLPGLTIPHEIQNLGLLLFVYCIGLQAGPSFFTSFKREGLRLNIAGVIALLATATVAVALTHLTGRSSTMLAGIFSGALTTTPALGAVTEALTTQGRVEEANFAVVGYGVGYPVAIIFVLLLVHFLSSRPHHSEPAYRPLVAGPAITLLIEKLSPNGGPWTVESLQRATGVLLTRCRHPDGRNLLGTVATELPVGTLSVLVGTPEQIQKATTLAGSVSLRALTEEQTEFDVHRYFVSKHDVVERPLRDLPLLAVGAVISRLRRGDVDLPVHAETRLHLGDRVKVIAHRDNEPAVQKYFGNSLDALSETSYFSFGVGVVIGLMLGQIPLPMPFLDHPVRLGMAGGALMAALLLGSRGRTGPFVWTIPLSVNLTLRHLGLLFFLAAVGIRAGRGLLPILREDGLMLIAMSLAVVGTAHGVFLLCLKLLQQRGAGLCFGAMGGLQTQPAVLAFAQTKTTSETLRTAYTTVYPLALILKIVLAQLVLRL